MNLSEQKSHPQQHPPTVVVSVNNREVVFSERKADGLQIKETAIEQGVPIQINFKLFIVNGQHLKPVDDTDQVELHPNLKFRAVAPDDNS